MVKTPIPYLLHIRDAIETINNYIGNYNFEQFMSDQKTRDAVVRQLEIIGEAASKLENEIKSEYPAVPWRDISDFRNVLAHEYWDIDMEIVWKAARNSGIKECVSTNLKKLLSRNIR
jgi:uncharacterized protein with HEPN domain